MLPELPREMAFWLEDVAWVSRMRCVELFDQGMMAVVRCEVVQAIIRSGAMVGREP